MSAFITIIKAIIRNNSTKIHEQNVTRSSHSLKLRTYIGRKTRNNKLSKILTFKGEILFKIHMAQNRGFLNRGPCDTKSPIRAVITLIPADITTDAAR